MLMDLSVEAMVVDPQWEGLFTLEERTAAAATLREYGFDPGTCYLAPELPVRVRREFSFDWNRGPSMGLDDLMLYTGRISACDLMGTVASKLHDGS